jgi:hypothetical protein
MNGWILIITLLSSPADLQPGTHQPPHFVGISTAVFGDLTACTTARDQLKKHFGPYVDVACFGQTSK